MCLYCKSNSVDSCCNNINSQCPNQNKALSSGAIAGIVMGSIAAAALLAFGFIFFNKHKRRGHRISGYRAPYHHSSLVVAYLKSPSRTPSPEDDRDREIDPSTSNDNRESSMTSIENPAMVDFSEPEFSGYFVVKHPYVPQIQDELLLRPDDIVTIHIEFDDGWALGINRSLGLRGAFPLVCIASARPELVDQISVDSPEELEGYDTPLRSTAEDTLGRDALFSGDLSTSTGANTSAKSTAAQLVKRSLTLHTTNLALSTTHSPTAATDIPRRASSVRGHSSNTTTPHSGPSPITSSINLHQPSPARLRQHGSGVTGTGGGLTGEGGGGGADDPIEMQFTPHRSELQDSSNAGSTRSSGEEYSEGGRSNLDVSSPTSQTGLTFRK
ncbi:hypothetical protein BC936DRAFT_147079 [Jimgerdemannia flammicorona]|uniref:SH3 domain-containing protein n=1 Tax=Jimgerdemannia flammicorona TaxID=994334 RepID=A0A433D6A1_9FUNG|nr:hypothetical protein BC936DRAFT_147079 [Jimgerdemannia flammicorona]